MSNPRQISAPPRRRQCVAGATQRRVFRPPFLIGLLLCACGFMVMSCRSSAPPAAKSGSAETQKVAFTTPPFSTKEPDRYQALRVTSVETGGGENSSSSQTNQVLIARDGERRREEYSTRASGRIVHLEIPAGRFIVLPANRMYADLTSASHQADQVKRSEESPELSPDQLLNEAHAPATYEKLGTETLAGRTTTKYRVVAVTGTEAPTETLIWIDEALGIPVRSETMSKSNGHSTKVTMELKEVKLEVDESLFSWPTDYRKVEPRVILDLTRKDGKPAVPKQ